MINKAKHDLQTISIFFMLIIILTNVSSCGIRDKQKSDPSNNTEITSYFKYTKEWPEWVMKTIPEYSYGELFKAEIYNGLHTLHFKDVFQGNTPYEAYLNELVQQGWLIETDGLEGFHMEMAFLSMGDFQLTYDVSYDSNEAFITYSKSDLHLKKQK